MNFKDGDIYMQIHRDVELIWWERRNGSWYNFQVPNKIAANDDLINKVLKMRNGVDQQLCRGDEILVHVDPS